MIGTVVVKISVWEDKKHSYCIDDEIKVKATAECVSERLSGYSDRPYTYQDYYDDIEVYDEDDIFNYVHEHYGDIDFDWYIDEESFEVE
jgi:hypothetical protein